MLSKKKKKIWILVTILWYKCFHLPSKCFHQQSTILRNHHLISHFSLQIHICPPGKLLHISFKSKPQNNHAKTPHLPSLQTAAFLLCKLKIFYACLSLVPTTLLEWQVYISVPLLPGKDLEWHPMVSHSMGFLSIWRLKEWCWSLPLKGTPD